MKWRLPAIAAATLAATMTPAHAAGLFDGTWKIEAPAVRGGAADSDLDECEAVRFETQIKDGNIVGTLRRSIYSQSGTNVQSTPGQGATAVQGNVSQDGSLQAKWQGYRATGRLSGDNGELRWKGACGERVATMTRTVKVQPALSGTSVPPPPREHQIYFGLNKASLTPESQKIIAELVDEARAQPTARIMITGKADRTGTDTYNMQLSERRAQTVARALVSAGISADRIQHRAVGEGELAVPTADGVAESKNRVADVIFQ